MDDLISRQAAIDGFAKAAREKFSLSDEFGHYLEGLKDADEVVRALPPVQPKNGKWILLETAYEDTEAKCSICGFYTLVNEPGNGLHMVDDLNYCPHCGAFMRGDTDD